jgi:hypothetical protein
MDFAGLLDDHRAQLGRALERFRGGDDDLARHLRQAGRWLDARWPRVIPANLELEAGIALYEAPADCRHVYGHDWGRYNRRRPWDPCAPGFPPLLQCLNGEFWLTPAPTAAQIGAWGAVLPYFYAAAHAIDEDEVTPAEHQRGAVLLAALIEAMRDLASETAVVQLHKGLAGIPTAGTPAYLYERLQEEWERR